ncbi:hypothetical protein PFICI_03169 [Pestalotiopsis fici W106-1]|uniref:Uncharacterized protein n=1 Tax=Pestalotiopsis fici (strain W106-1 / CGMCC3.15140) TaxID=1229662 RepID=W3XGK7_PESFW|nr:uncharacterized protein PFICI_03169 [Pestalotiopsis fici W106-1]ETS85144.1 hypothetical protein PFICI_03169 [Pestalotiopsis fici W106-1]
MGISMDVLWRVGRNHIHDPRDLFSLATTCETLWELLENEIYIADILLARDLPSARPHCRCRMRNVSINAMCRHFEWCETRHHILRGPFHAAAQRGDAGLVSRISNLALPLWPQYIDTKDPEGYSPLLLASSKGHIDVVKFLHDMGCYIDAYVVVPHLNLDQVTRKHLLGRVFEDLTANSMTLNPFTIAILGGHEELATYLMSFTAIADLEVTTHWEITADWERNRFPGTRKRTPQWMLSGAHLPSPYALAVVANMQPVLKALFRAGIAEPRIGTLPSALFLAATFEGNESILDLLCSEERMHRHWEMRQRDAYNVDKYDGSLEPSLQDLWLLRTAIESGCPRNALCIIQNFIHVPVEFDERPQYCMEIIKDFALCPSGATLVNEPIFDYEYHLYGVHYHTTERANGQFGDSNQTNGGVSDDRDEGGSD